MKKIALYITILVSMVFYVSCNLNDYPTFDDKDAFVGFETERVSVKEDADSIVIPVRLTSLKGKAATVTYEIIDSTAVQGVDFDLRDGASVLTYKASDPVQNIKFDIIPQIGTFTGDLMFGIAIKTVTGVNKGSNDTIYVTIQDIDHPLSALLGTYEVYGPNYFSMPDTWDVEFEKDADGDVSKVWISNLVVEGTSLKVYGIVNAEKNKIEIPVKQEIAKSASYDLIVLEGFDDPDINKADFLPDGSKLTLNLTSSDPIVFTMDLPFGSHIVDVDSWYSIVLAGAKFTKK